MFNCLAGNDPQGFISKPGFSFTMIQNKKHPINGYEETSLKKKKRRVKERSYKALNTRRLPGLFAVSCFFCYTSFMR